ncbi:hypothetical protein [Chryseobacterium lactis]|uniref:hypothetical protein n=1 Tax=Chryseobacterium lactis TaxID=1241981 RepID=UPI00063D144B|nr:hypothetical protein [Chryseobacterium lactis]
MRLLEYNIKGVDLKAELIMGFSIVPFILIFGQLSATLYTSFKNVEFRNIPFFIFLGGGLAGMTVGLTVAKILGKKMSAIWKIELNDESLSIRFKNRSWRMELDEISKLKIYGNSNFKYISIFKNDENIRMRIGNSGLTPFSTQDDLKELDNFITEIRPYFEKNYSKKEGIVKQSPSGTVKLTYLKK